MSQNSSRVQQDEVVVYSVVTSIINAHAAVLLKARAAHALSYGARQHHAFVGATTSRNSHLSTVTQSGGMMTILCVDEMMMSRA